MSSSLVHHQHTAPQHTAPKIFQAICVSGPLGVKKASAGNCLLTGEGEIEGEHRAGHKAGAHHSKPGGGPAKPLCKNFGQLPKLTGEWVDHPDPLYRGIYSQVG